MSGMPGPSSARDAQQPLAELNETYSLFCPGGKVTVTGEVPLPTLSLSDYATKWKHPRDEGIEKQRYDLPQSSCTDKLADFASHLRTSNYEPSTITGWVASMRKLLGMLDYNCGNGENFSYLGILLASYHQDKMRQLFDLEILNSKHH